VATDTVTVNTGEPVAANKGLLQVNESAVTEIIEIWVEFSLTQQQVEREATVIDPSKVGRSRDDPGADGGVTVTVAFPARCGR